METENGAQCNQNNKKRHATPTSLPRLVVDPNSATGVWFVASQATFPCYQQYPLVAIGGFPAKAEFALEKGEDIPMLHKTDH